MEVMQHKLGPVKPTTGHASCRFSYNRTTEKIRRRIAAAKRKSRSTQNPPQTQWQQLRYTISSSNAQSHSTQLPSANSSKLQQPASSTQRYTAAEAGSSSSRQQQQQHAAAAQRQPGAPEEPLEVPAGQRGRVPQDVVVWHAAVRDGGELEPALRQPTSHEVRQLPTPQLQLMRAGPQNPA